MTIVVLAKLAVHLELVRLPVRLVLAIRVAIRLQQWPRRHFLSLFLLKIAEELRNIVLMHLRFEGVWQ